MPSRTPARALAHGVVTSPLGPLAVVVDGDGALAGLYYLPVHTPAPKPSALGDPLGAERDDGDPLVAAVRRAGDAVLAYLDGSAEAVVVPLADAPGTDLQRAVWEVVAAIPRGRTRTYGEVAAAIGRPTAVRAVGQAVGRNPTCLAVPCHRVLGSGGRITGYAGGAARKRWLLALEAGEPLPDLGGDLSGQAAPAPGAPPSAP